VRHHVTFRLRSDALHGDPGLPRQVDIIETYQSFDASPERIRALQKLVLATDTLQDFLGHVARQAASIGPDLCCGITVSTDPRRPLTVGTSDATAVRLDETQYSKREGPCLEAMHTSQTIEVTDATSETRWSSYMTPPHHRSTSQSVTEVLKDGVRGRARLRTRRFRRGMPGCLCCRRGTTQPPACTIVGNPAAMLRSLVRIDRLGSS
jgi:hypothetical protein